MTTLSTAARLAVVSILMTALSVCGAGFAQQVSELKVFFVDVEGGQSTLFVTPGGESLLIDTGWPENNYRDADRILEVARQAHLTKIDYVLITHYHDDHVGGVAQLVSRIPVGTFIDHGPNREPGDAVTERDYEKYQQVLTTGASKHILAHPGDTLPIKGMNVKVLSADGDLISRPLSRAGAMNDFCKTSEIRPSDQTENARSIGVEITFGKLKLLDLGDLTWDKETQLMCPVNKLGQVDVFIVSHHGWLQSSSPALVYAIHPRVAIMDNGEKKGGSTATLVTMAKSPGLETLWQLHYSAEGGLKNNTKEQYIANLQGVDAGHSIELIGERDGSFQVANSRTNVTRKYAAASH